MKLIIDNRDTPFTIDTYGMFNGESFDEMESEFIIDEYGIAPDDIDFEYDHKGIVSDLAAKSVDVITDILGDNENDVVRSISAPLSTGSPQFYNFTTDWYTAEWDINELALLKFIQANATEWRQYILDEWREIVANKPVTLEMLQADDNKLMTGALAFWAQQFDDEYKDSMFEGEHEIYSENVTYSNSMQRALDAKESEKA